MRRGATPKGVLNLGRSGLLIIFRVGIRVGRRQTGNYVQNDKIEPSRTTRTNYRYDMLEAGGLPEREHAPCTSLLSDRYDMWRQADYQNEHAPCTSLLLSPIRGGNYCAAQRLQTSDGQAARASRLLALARGRHGVGDHVQASALTGCA